MKLKRENSGLMPLLLRIRNQLALIGKPKDGGMELFPVSQHGVPFLNPGVSQTPFP